MQELELSQNRFEEVDSDDESVSSAAYARYMGYDGPSRQQAVPVHAYKDLAYDDDYDPEDDYERSAEWQIAMREKEEELAERALRRIRRARLRGESNVNLSREELDALERRQHREELERRPPAKALQSEPPARQRAKSNAASRPQPKRKTGGGMFGLGGSPKSKPSNKSHRRVASPEEDTQLQLPPVSSNSSLQRLNGGSPKASRRPSRSRMSQQPAQQSLYDLQNPSNYRPSSSRSSRRGDSPTRSLPDDPDWVPRPRSASNAHSYPPLPAAASGGAVDPFVYQVQGPTGRRIVSDPTVHQSVNYSSVRRNPPRQAQATARGRQMEVVDLTSDDEEEEEEGEDELAAEDEGGVSVEVMPEARGGYRIQQQAGPADAGLPRARKNRER